MAAPWSLSLVGCSLLMLIPVHFCDGADPSYKSTFHDTGHLLWKDCGDSNAWIKFTAFDMTPRPLHLPGNGTITIHGSNGNTAFDKNVALRVDIKKYLLGLWSSIPCTGPTTPTDQRIGSCTYRDPCEILQRYFPSGNCPDIFNREGLPCTCPFTISAHKTLNVNNEPVSFAAIGSGFTQHWFDSGEFYIKLTMYEPGQAIARMCFEAYVNLSPDSYNPVPTHQISVPITPVPTHQIWILTGPQGFQWQSNPADGATLNILAGDDVTIPWTYTASSGYVISGINWFFRGSSEELVAMFTHSMFMALPAFSGRVQHTTNGGLTLKHVTLGDSGNYSVEVTGQDANGHAFTQRRSVDLHVSGYLEWQGNTTDGETRSVTQGSDVTIPWTFTTDGVISSVTWFFKVTSEQIVAQFTHNQFFVLPAFSGRVQQVTNGGITLKHVTVSDSGTYIVEVTGHDVNGTAFTQRRSLVLHVSVV